MYSVLPIVSNNVSNIIINIPNSTIKEVEQQTIHHHQSSRSKNCHYHDHGHFFKATTCTCTALLPLPNSFFPIQKSQPSITITRQELSPDVHDLLQKSNLPKGVLPGNVKSYSLSSEDSSFTIELTHHCYVQFKDQLVLYDKILTGKLGYGKVSDVTGIHAKKLFSWVSVTGMDVDDSSNMIEFDFGVLAQSLPADEFQTIPTCQNKGLQGFSLLASA